MSSDQSIKSEEFVIKEPEIPFNREKVFLPLRRTLSGKIVPTFQYFPCVKKFLGVCTKKEKKLLEFHDLEWFLMNNFVLMRMPSL